MTEQRPYWRLCTTCRKQLPFGEIYWICSVSTCNRKKMPFTFCSVACWDAHLPVMRHRSAWAEEKRAPSRQQWEREQASAVAEEPQRIPRQRIAPQTSAPFSLSTQEAEPDIAPEVTLRDADLPRDILIVVSRLKAYIKARSGMKTSDSVLPVLSDMVRERCDEAIRKASRKGRKTVLDRDLVD